MRRWVRSARTAARSVSAAGVVVLVAAGSASADGASQDGLLSATSGARGDAVEAAGVCPEGTVRAGIEAVHVTRDGESQTSLDQQETTFDGESGGPFSFTLDVFDESLPTGSFILVFGYCEAELGLLADLQANVELTKDGFVPLDDIFAQPTPLPAGPDDPGEPDGPDHPSDGGSPDGSAPPVAPDPSSVDDQDDDHLPDTGPAGLSSFAGAALAAIAIGTAALRAGRIGSRRANRRAGAQAGERQ